MASLRGKIALNKLFPFAGAFLEPVLTFPHQTRKEKEEEKIKGFFSETLNGFSLWGEIESRNSGNLVGIIGETPCGFGGGGKEAEGRGGGDNYLNSHHHQRRERIERGEI